MRGALQYCLIALIGLTSCKTKQTIELSAPVESHKYEPEHSPNVFLVMYDKEIGKPVKPRLEVK